MKSFKTFTESIIDIPRRIYAPGVFDNADTENPKLKQKVLDIIKKDLKTFEKFGPIVSVKLIGSILGKRYRNDADLDIDVLIDLPPEDREIVGLEARKSVADINGKNIPGTNHPVNYYIQSDPDVNDAHLKTATGIFDVFKQKFDKKPKEQTFDPKVYAALFQHKVAEIDVVKGELKRDILDYDELKELSPKDIVDLQKRIDEKLEEIKDAIEKFSVMGDELMQARRDLFNRPLTPEEIRKYGIAHKLPKNVIFKYLEKFYYTEFFKKCKKILDDGKVTDAEIDSLRKEHAQSETRAVAEALDKGNTLVFAFGRFNPPTVGHGKLMSKVITEARKNNANHIVYASASTDKRSNPLDVKTKVKFMKKMFPANKIQAAGGNQRTFIEVLKFYDKIYGNIIMIAGSDRVSEFQKLTDKYNGKEYNFKSIKVVSSGERDPDAEGITGMSASKMREMAKNGDAKNFKKGVPNLSDSDASELFNAVRKGMGISGRNYPLIINSFTNFVNNDLREEYHQEKIFNVGDMVEHMDGTSGMVVRRGSNYVSYETDDNLIKKAWLYDIQPSEKQPEKKTNILETVEKELEEGGIDTVIRHLRRFTVDRGKIKAGISAFKDLVSKGVESSKAAWDASRLINVSPREFIDALKSANLYKESFGFGTDEYAQHTMSMTPGQPIQNFRKSSDQIKYKDIEEFSTQSETIDKYKKRFKERWREELDKAVQRMREEL
jgi:nicotinic acid mononucleotide adenylyltransferase/predicted nucleotidyltransferase